MIGRNLGTADLDLLATLFEELTDCPFFVKDVSLQYVAANAAMARLCGAGHASDVVGRSTRDFFPEALARRYEALDRQILVSGKPITKKIDLNVGARRGPAWLVFTRAPVRDARGHVVGVAAAARRFGGDGRSDATLTRLAQVVERVRENPAAPFELKPLARIAGVSGSQLERDFQRVFAMSPRAFHRKTRMEAAMELLERGDRITDVAHACGFTDHSAFSRTFRDVLGMTPRAYRAAMANAAESAG